MIAQTVYADRPPEDDETFQVVAAGINEAEGIAWAAVTVVDDDTPSFAVLDED